MYILGINVIKDGDTFVVGDKTWGDGTSTLPNVLTLTREIKHRANVSMTEAAAAVDAAIVADAIFVKQQEVIEIPKINPKEFIKKAKEAVD